MPDDIGGPYDDDEEPTAESCESTASHCRGIELHANSAEGASVKLKNLDYGYESDVTVDDLSNTGDGYGSAITGNTSTLVVGANDHDTSNNECELQLRWSSKINGNYYLQARYLKAPTNSETFGERDMSEWSTLYGLEGVPESSYTLGHQAWPDASVDVNYSFDKTFEFGGMVFTLDDDHVSNDGYLQLYVQIPESANVVYTHDVADATAKMPLFIYVGDNTDSANSMNGVSAVWPAITTATYYTQEATPTPVPQPTPTPTQTPANSGQLGSIIGDATTTTTAGEAVSFNETGNRVAVGTPSLGSGLDNTGVVRIYEWNNTDWVQMGSDLEADLGTRKFGNSVSLNHEGNRVIIGAYSSGTAGNWVPVGLVKVYEWSGSEWNQLGSSITSATSVVREFGFDVSCDSSGNRFVTSIEQTGNTDDPTWKASGGQIEVFDWNGETWNQVGSAITGDFTYLRLGHSVAMASNGNRFVAGVNGYDSDPVDARVYEWNGSDWSQVGSGISTDTPKQGMEQSVDINNAGDRIIIGDHDATPDIVNQRGTIRVYQLTDNSWVQMGSTIVGTSRPHHAHSQGIGNDLGQDVSMNTTGDRIAVTRQGDNSVVIYDWNGTSWLQAHNLTQEITITGTGFGSCVDLNGLGNRVAVGVVNGAALNMGYVVAYQL